MGRSLAVIMGIGINLLGWIGICGALDCSNPEALACPYILERHIEHYNPANVSPGRAFPFHMTADYHLSPGAPTSLGVRYPGHARPIANVVTTASAPGFVFVEPESPRRVQLAILSRGVPDQPGTGTETAKDYKIYYRVSQDGGRHYDTFRPVIQRGNAYTALHPMAGVYVGINGAVVAGLGHINRASNGDLLVPIAIWPLAPQCVATPESCHAYAPKYKVTTYTEAHTLLGRWTTDGLNLTWELSQPARVSEEQSTCGTVEPAIIELKSPGSCLLIARGSNQGKTWMPSYYWLFHSNDGCRTWDGPARPWGYSDGSRFMSPAAPSALYRSAQNGRLYWIGSMAPVFPKGTKPRTKIVIGEVDEQKLGLIRDTVVVIDEKNDQDTPNVELTNFRFYPQKDGTVFLYLRRAEYEKYGADVAFPVNWYRLGFTLGLGQQP